MTGETLWNGLGMDEQQSLIETIGDLSLSMPSSLKAIADFLLLEGSGVENLSMSGIAQATYTSKPTLVRFAKQLGFTGWPEFRLAFLKEARAADQLATNEVGVDINYPFVAGDSAQVAASNVLRVRELAAEEIRKRLNDDLLNMAARAILDAPQVALFSRPPGWYLESVFAYNLNSIGKGCWIPHAEESDLALNLFSTSDCSIFASYAGMLAKEPLCYAEDVKRRGATVIAITSDNSPLALVADIALTFPPIERYYNKVTGFYSCACIELWLDALFAACYLQQYEDNAHTRRIRSAQLAPMTHVLDDFRDERSKFLGNNI